MEVILTSATEQLAQRHLVRPHSFLVSSEENEMQDGMHQPAAGSNSLCGAGFAIGTPRKSANECLTAATSASSRIHFSRPVMNMVSQRLLQASPARWASFRSSSLLKTARASVSNSEGSPYLKQSQARISLHAELTLPSSQGTHQCAGARTP